MRSAILKRSIRSIGEQIPVDLLFEMEYSDRRNNVFQEGGR